MRRLTRGNIQPVSSGGHGSCHICSPTLLITSWAPQRDFFSDKNREKKNIELAVSNLKMESVDRNQNLYLSQHVHI